MWAAADWAPRLHRNYVGAVRPGARSCPRCCLLVQWLGSACRGKVRVGCGPAPPPVVTVRRRLTASARATSRDETICPTAIQYGRASSASRLPVREGALEWAAGFALLREGARVHVQCAGGRPAVHISKGRSSRTHFINCRQQSSRRICLVCTAPDRNAEFDLQIRQ